MRKRKNLILMFLDMSKRIKHNDLTHYFIREHSTLPAAYLASCEKFFKTLKCRQASASCHPDGWPAGRGEGGPAGHKLASKK